MTPTDIPAYMAHVGVAARSAATAMAAASSAAKNRALQSLARRLRDERLALQQANARDIDAALGNGLAAPMVDRLKLTDAVIATVAASSFVGTSVYAISGLLLQDPVVSVGDLLPVILASVVWDVLLTPLVLPGLMRLFTALEPGRVPA